MLSTKLKAAAGNSADATLYVNDVFSTYLYTGNNTSQNINNGIDLAGKGGMVWQRSRTSAQDNHLWDTARGANYDLVSNSTAAQYNRGGTNGVTSFNSDGFTITGNQGDFNASSDTYASWTFRKAAKFFDVVTYTGNSSVQNIAHSLGVAPGMIIVKRTNTAEDWYVQHRGLTSYDNALRLNTTVAQLTSTTFWNSTAPTATDFTLGNNGSVNGTGNTYVAYLFAHDTSSTGIIQCGSYTGNGSATGPVVTLGWEPQYLMVKKASGTGNWQVIDSMRGMPVGSADATLQPNLANAESSVEYLSPTATGFQITSTSTEVNTSGSTYIYMAIRRPNKPPTTGTQVYNAVSYTGNGTANREITSNFVVDLAIGMQRTPANGSDRFFVDRLRGATKGLVSWDTFAEATDANSLTSFASMTGVVVGTDTTDRGFNGNGRSLNPYFFKRAPGFFDVVCFTYSGSVQTVPHNLTVVPELMIVKNRTGAADGWNTYLASLGNTSSLELQSTAATRTGFGGWGSTTPTASNFYIQIGASGVTYVAYLFATLAGISKVGSYTGNGTGQVIACGFSAGARFVLIKRTDSTGNWYTFDSARGLTVGSSPYLLLNSTAAEVTGNNGVYQSTGGFTLGATAITTTNIATATYIFLAVA